MIQGLWGKYEGFATFNVCIKSCLLTSLEETIQHKTCVTLICVTSLFLLKLMYLRNMKNWNSINLASLHYGFAISASHYLNANLVNCQQQCSY